MIRKRLEDIIGIRFNAVLANMYRDGHDHVAWHSDNEPSLGPEPTIASLSFGDERNFQLRKNPPVVSILSSSIHTHIAKMKTKNHNEKDKFLSS